MEIAQGEHKRGGAEDGGGQEKTRRARLCMACATLSDICALHPA